MKATRKIIGRLIAGCVLACCLSLFTLQTFATEGLQVSIQGTNAVLSWPSDYTSGETYIIQYRTTLSVTDSWSTLADTYPADSGTNITSFIDTNLVNFGYGTIGGTNSGSIDPGSTNYGTMGTNVIETGTSFYRVVRDGAHLFGITNGSLLSGKVNIPVELANDGGTVQSVCITENGTPVGNAVQIAPNIAPIAMTLDTTFMVNGDHTIVASARLDDTNGSVWELDSPAITVTVSNEISFENWMPYFGQIGDTLLFRATSAHTNTDWIVSVYDNTNGYVGYFSEHTYNGDISFYWDYSGTIYTNTPSFSFEIATEYVDPPAPPTYKQADPWTASGAWVFACQHAFDYLTDHETLYEEMNGLLGAVKGSYTVRPSQSGNDSYALDFQGGNEVANWTTFKSALYNSTSRNLVYFGHGGPTGIGYNSHDPNVFISSTEIANALHTIPAGQTNRHAFRFVYLDGCGTAKGNLPEAFGMFNRPNVDGIDYYNASLRRSAFCGWSASKVVGLSAFNVINYDHVSYITLLNTYLLLGDGIKTAADLSASQPYIPTVNTSEFVILGYWDLHIGTDNN